MKISLYLILLLLFVNKIFSKQINQIITINPSTTRKYLFQPLAFFTCDIGDCKYNVEFLLPKESSDSKNKPGISLLIFLDNYWDEVLSLIKNLETKSQCEKIQNLKNINRELNWKQDEFGNLKSTLSGSLKQRVRPHTWYYVIVESCNENKKEYTDLIEITAKIQVNQSNDSQFSYEEYGIQKYYYILFFINLAFLLYAVYEIMKSKRKDEQLDEALVGMMIVLIIATVSIIFKSIELMLYNFDGSERPFLRGMQVMTETLVGFLVTVILIFLGLGWTVLFNSITQYKFFLPSIASFAALQIAIFILTKIFSNKTNFQYHDYQGVLGVLLVLIRLVLYSIFIRSVILTYSKVKQKIQIFMIKLSIYGSIYFLTFPILLMVVELVVADYWKFTVIMIGTFALQEAAIMLLIKLFLAKNTEYYKISLKSHSPLPFEKMD